MPISNVVLAPVTPISILPPPLLFGFGAVRGRGSLFAVVVAVVVVVIDIGFIVRYITIARVLVTAFIFVCHPPPLFVLAHVIVVMFVLWFYMYYIVVLYPRVVYFYRPPSPRRTTLILIRCPLPQKSQKNTRLVHAERAQRLVKLFMNVSGLLENVVDYLYLNIMTLAVI